MHKHMLVQMRGLDKAFATQRAQMGLQSCMFQSVTLIAGARRAFVVTVWTLKWVLVDMPLLMVLEGFQTSGLVATLLTEVVLFGVFCPMFSFMLRKLFFGSCCESAVCLHTIKVHMITQHVDVYLSFSIAEIVALGALKFHVPLLVRP